MTPEQKRVRDNLIAALSAYELALFEFTAEQIAELDPLEIASRIIIGRGHGLTGPEAIDWAVPVEFR